MSIGHHEKAASFGSILCRNQYVDLVKPDIRLVDFSSSKSHTMTTQLFTSPSLRSVTLYQTFSYRLVT